MTEPTLLKRIVRERHWTYQTFRRAYESAAERIGLTRHTISERQYERWLGGRLDRLPQPDACRILEEMFGRRVEELIAPPAAEGHKPVTCGYAGEASGDNASPDDPHDDEVVCLYVPAWTSDGRYVHMAIRVPRRTVLFGGGTAVITGLAGSQAGQTGGATITAPAAAPTGTVSHPAVPAIRDALLSAPTAAPDQPPALDALRAEVERAHLAWQHSPRRYTLTGAVLPGLLATTQLATHAYDGPQRRTARALFAETAHLARSFLKRVGHHDLSLIAAERSVVVAREADNPLLLAMSDWNHANILADRGHGEEARHIALNAARRLEPQLADAPPQWLAVWGALHLLVIGPVDKGDRATGWKLLDTGQQAAHRLGGDRNDFWTSFGPTNVGVHAVWLAVEQNEFAKATALGERVDASGMYSVERQASHYFALARAHAALGDAAAAVHHLRAAERVSPEDLHYHPRSQETLRELLARDNASVRADVHALARRAGVAA